MRLKVVKRTGDIENFSKMKIKKSIMAAFKESKIKFDIEVYHKAIEYIEEECDDNRECEFQIGEIQDHIESAMNDLGYCDVAKKFILYRHEHNRIREFVKQKEEFIQKYKDANNTANATIDDNSNVGCKNIGVMNSELHKTDNLHVNRKMVMNKLKELYPDFDAKQYIRDLHNHIIYKHDESSMVTVPYCCAITMYPFISDGLKKLGGLSAAPKNLDSYCGMFVNLIFAISSMFAGACAVPEALLYFDFYARKEWGDDYYKKNDNIAKPGRDLLRLLNETHYWCNTVKELKEHDFGSFNTLRDSIVENTDRTTTKEEMEQWEKSLAENGSAEMKLGDDTRTIRSIIRQCFQQIIYSINQPAAARGMQSAFVNFSYFDKYYFEGMFGNFTFPDFTKPIWESFNWLQREFMMWFNEERTKTVLTFPVESFAMLYKDGEFQDKDSFDFVSSEYERGHSFFTYISDSVDSLSSCCFDGDQTVIVKRNADDGPIMTTFRTLSGIKDGRILVQSPSFDGGTPVWVDAELVEASSKSFVRIGLEIVKGKLLVTSDHMFPVRDENSEFGFKDVSASEITVGMSVMWTDEYGRIDWLDVTDVESVEYDEEQPAYCFRICQKNAPYFILPNGVVSHNCRLKNKLQTEFAFTNGNIGVETGSKSVITLNLNRIIQDWYKSILTKDDSKMLLRKSTFVDGIVSETENWGFRDYLVAILERVYKYHEAYNEILWDMYDADLLPAYKAGFISLNKQYLTIGLNGLNQAAEFLDIQCSDNERYAKFCQTIFGIIKEQNTKHRTDKMMFNTEQVPAESLAVKNYNWDYEDGYWVPKDTNLYASYVFKPNDVNMSVMERLRLHGKNYIGDYLDGGAAAHINLSEHLSKEQYKKILDYSAKVGCQYLTFNVPNTECKDCGHISKNKHDRCPKCGSERLYYWDRVIGYLTRIDKWSDGRQKEQKTRVYGDFSDN